MTQPPTGTAPEVAEAGFQSWLDRVIALTGLGAGLAALVFAAEQAVWLDRRWLAVVAGALLVSSLLLPVGAWSRWGLRRPTVVYAGVAVRLWTWPLAWSGPADPVADQPPWLWPCIGSRLSWCRRRWATGGRCCTTPCARPATWWLAIGRTLYITENSVKEYLKRIRAKYTQVDRPAVTKLDLFRRAVEDGIVPPIEPRI